MFNMQDLHTFALQSCIQNIVYFTILLKTANRFSTVTKIIRAYPFFWLAATKEARCHANRNAVAEKTRRRSRKIV